MQIAADLKLKAVIIGGIALPAYNVVRSTLDLDLCVSFPSQTRLQEFLDALAKKGIRTLQKPKINHDLFVIFGNRNEAEIRLHPCDAFKWDEEMENRITKFGSKFYVLSIEDYLLTKLARDDRSSIDISDILQILIVSYKEIDWEYFYFRLKLNKQLSSIQSIWEEFASIKSQDNSELREIFDHIKEKLNMAI